MESRKLILRKEEVCPLMINFQSYKQMFYIFDVMKDVIEGNL